MIVSGAQASRRIAGPQIGGGAAGVGGIRRGPSRYGAKRKDEVSLPMALRNGDGVIARAEVINAARCVDVIPGCLRRPQANRSERNRGIRNLAVENAGMQVKAKISRRDGARCRR